MKRAFRRCPVGFVCRLQCALGQDQCDGIDLAVDLFNPSICACTTSLELTSRLRIRAARLLAECFHKGSDMIRSPRLPDAAT